MDTIDDCEIECKFMKREKGQLEERFYVISSRLKNIKILCELLNLVCKKKYEPSCYQLKIDDSYDTSKCVTTPNEESREIYCFKISEKMYFVVVAQEIDTERYIVTFFPFEVYKPRDFRKLKRKCDDKFFEVS